MAPSLYLVNPASDAPSYFSAEVFAGWGLPPAAFVADLATTTVAAMATGFDVRITDEHVGPVDLEADADVVGLTGKVNQARRMLELADAFRERGRTVVIGGPFASLSPEVVRPHCDVLVRGEIEDIGAELFADLAAGRARADYLGTRPELDGCPVPRWDLYPNEAAMMGVVQTARGCPFDCEFCDVIQYLGRKQRNKPVERVVAELDALYAAGYRDVFIADDNFTVYRRRARAVLEALRDWNRRQTDGKVAFSTQVSIDAARDEELLALAAEAGLTSVFVGLETPNQASLKETRKRQNLGRDMIADVRRFLAHGIVVMGGLIVGFDHDGTDIFDMQHDFAMAAPVPLFTLGALVAPAATPLYDRLAAAGRLVNDGPEVAANPWDTNVLPAQMPREALLTGLRDLAERLYHPDAFGERCLAMIDALGPRTDPVGLEGHALGRAGRPMYRSARRLLVRLAQLGPAEARMSAAVARAVSRRPEAGDVVVTMLLRYAQVRYMLGGSVSVRTSTPASA